jgi:hypothetical protein
MERLIIGSSNVYRFYRPDTFKQFKNYNMVRCTDIVTFRALTENLEENESEVVISVIENFLERSVKDETTEEAILTSLGETIDAFLQIIKDASTRLPNSKFAIAEPIKRPKMDWYQKNLDDVQRTIKEGIESMRMDNVSRIEGIPEGCQQFEQDQVHLTQAAGDIFIEGLLTNSEKFFTAPVVTIEDNIDEDIPDLSETELLSQRMDKLEKLVVTKQVKDNYVFAKIREEMDANTNRQKEDRVVITGITSSVYPPTDPVEKKAWIRKIVTDIFNTLIPNFGGEILFVNQGKNNGKLIPLVEVKLNSTENASKIRKAFADKKKQGVDLGRIFVSNSVNLATRVRVDILKALARKVTGQQVVAYAIPFISRPTLQVKATGGGQSNPEIRSYNFTDAIAKYGHLVKQFDLGEAYRRAGSFFKGQLEQNFVVLKDRDVQQQQQHQPRPQPRGGYNRGRFPAAGFSGGSRKRTRDDETETEEAGIRNWSDEPSGSYQRGNSGFKRPWRGNRYQRK